MKRGVSLWIVCVLPVLLASCTTAPSGNYVLKDDVVALEKRVESLESRKTATGDTGALEGRIAALEQKVSALPAGAGPAGPAGGVLRIGVPGSSKSVWKCPKLPTAPVIDGKLDEAAWKKAVQMTLSSDRETPVDNPTVILVAHDTKKLYIGAVCMESVMDQLKITCTKRDEKVWRDDCLEIYIDQQEDKKDATKICINPNGVFMDFIRLSSGDGDDVTLGIEAKTAKLKDRWVVELSLPIADLKVEYQPGLRMRFNVMRMRPIKGDSKERSTWCGKSNELRSLGKIVLE